MPFPIAFKKRFSKCDFSNVKKRVTIGVKLLLESSISFKFFMISHVNKNYFQQKKFIISGFKTTVYFFPIFKKNILA